MRQSWLWNLLLVTSLAFGLGGCSNAEKSGEGEKGGVSLPTAEKPIDQSYITDDFVAAVVLHPSRILNHKMVDELIKLADMTMAGGEIDKNYQKVLKETGIDVKKVEQIIVLVDEETATKAEEDGPDDDTIPAMIVRYGEAFDQQGLLDKLPKLFGKSDKSGNKVSAIPLAKKSHGEKSYYSAGPVSFSFTDDKTAIIAPEDVLKKMLDAGKSESALSKRLATLGAEHDLIIVGAGKKIEESFAKQAKNPFLEMPDAKPYQQYVDKVKSVAVTLSVTSDPMISIVLGMQDADSASGVAKQVNDTDLPKLKTKYEENKEQLSSTSAEGAKIADELVNSIAVGAKGADLIISIGRPSDLDRLPELVKKAMGMP